MSRTIIDAQIHQEAIKDTHVQNHYRRSDSPVGGGVAGSPVAGLWPRLFTKERPFLSDEDLDWIMGRAIAEWLEWQ